ncbi:MAG: flagellar basal body-associated FliL family protein [Leptospirales bacterium]|nr:flagellar basal body-associated FliL family protein [Leptospirales bacterium]
MSDDERDLLDDEEDSEGGSSAGETKATSKIVKILLFVAGGLLLIVLITGISYIVSKYTAEKNYARSQEIIAAPPPPPYSTFELPEFAKTTSDVEPHFFKMQISLAYEPSVELNNELIRRRDQILNTVNLLLMDKKYEDISTRMGAITLAEDIKAHINVSLSSGKIREVFFKDLIIN